MEIRDVVLFVRVGTCVVGRVRVAGGVAIANSC
jgi:hypothetical protein